MDYKLNLLTSKIIWIQKYEKPVPCRPHIYVFGDQITHDKMVTY